MTTAAPRQRLALPPQTAGTNGSATQVPEKSPAVPSPEVPSMPGKKPAIPAPRPPYKGGGAYPDGFREFEFLDGGRPVTVHKHAVYFVTPLQQEPETAVLVGVKSGSKPLPLRIAYGDFTKWLRGGK
jgi:hypothetical protein